MSIRSLFGKKDKVSSDGRIPMPQLPSQREILEDIDSINKNDPILSLAAILEKKGRHSVVDSDIKELIDALQKRKRRESTSSTSSTPLHLPFNLPLLSNTENERKGKASDVSKKGMVHSNSSTEDFSKLDYDKLKHFLTTCEHSQELISELESEFKKFQVEVTEYSKSLHGDSSSHSADIESNLLL